MKPAAPNPTDQEKAQRDLQEADLLARIAGGDERAFEELHRNYAGIVFNTVFRVLNDHQDAEDISQEVFRQIWERAHYFETSRGRPFTFITSMARNRAIDKLRAKQRAARNRDALEEHNRIAEFLTDADASDEAFAHEAGGYLRSAVMRLPEVQRRAIELVYFNELTQREAAEITGAPVGTIKARVRRGIAQLGGLLPKDQF